MKFLKINYFAAFIVVILCIAFANCEEDGKRNVLLRRPGGRPGGPLSKTSTTTAAPPPPENDEDIPEDEYAEGDLGEGENDDQDPSSTSTTTTTEPPKKIGPIVRPFRSNEDLLNALKRRQQNSKKGAKAVEKPAPKAQHEESERDEEPAPAPVQKSAPAAAGRRNKFSKSLKSPGSFGGGGDNVDEQGSSPVSLKRPGRLSVKTSK